MNQNKQAKPQKKNRIWPFILIALALLTLVGIFRGGKTSVSAGPVSYEHEDVKTMPVETVQSKAVQYGSGTLNYYEAPVTQITNNNPLDTNGALQKRTITRFTQPPTAQQYASNDTPQRNSRASWKNITVKGNIVGMYIEGEDNDTYENVTVDSNRVGIMKVDKPK